MPKTQDLAAAMAKLREQLAEAEAARSRATAQAALAKTAVKRATDFLATATAKRDASSKALDESAARAAAALQQAALEAEPPAAARPAAAAAVGDPDAQPVAADTPPVLSHSGCSVDSGTAARLRCAVHPTADGGFAVKCGWSLRAGGVVSGSRAGVHRAPPQPLRSLCPAETRPVITGRSSGPPATPAALWR
ncbi:hypothetical protein FNF29_04357 [Cafeteria roenbergensis]|uniref:Uncharacterized protein n=1 Tax=Cafeteria roenbergensis TaxID=33653 RepID=A0A5A8CIL2_CAFRO|nr:hypothetical protein FNF29_04357 [Cafeteria roenbergensis]|eukprot:KAA0151671.1 hypothetical protein FNF29_04357 [Cafeteria roenbergensis]